MREIIVVLVCAGIVAAYSLIEMLRWLEVRRPLIHWAAIWKSSGCYIQPSVDEIVVVKPDPTGLFLIDERCPGCLGTGRLRIDLLEDDLDDERAWRNLEITATKEWDWQIARTCTGCGLPFLCGKDSVRDFCGKGDCQQAYYKRGNVTLGTKALND